MNLKEYFGKDLTISDGEASRRFTKRHALGLWCAVLPFFGFFAAGIGVAKLNGHIGLFVALWVFGLLILAYVAFVYRCPRCGKVPHSSQPGTTGVLLFPKRCSNCKAPLLPHHRWAQD